MQPGVPCGTSDRVSPVTGVAPEFWITIRYLTVSPTENSSGTSLPVFGSGIGVRSQAFVVAFQTVFRTLMPGFGSTAGFRTAASDRDDSVKPPFSRLPRIGVISRKL